MSPPSSSSRLRTRAKATVCLQLCRLCSNRLKIASHIETNAAFPDHDPSASCMFYAVSLCSHETISTKSSAVIRTAACPTG